MGIFAALNAWCTDHLGGNGLMHLRRVRVESPRANPRSSSPYCLKLCPNSKPWKVCCKRRGSLELRHGPAGRGLGRHTVDGSYQSIKTRNNPAIDFKHRFWPHHTKIPKRCHKRVPMSESICTCGHVMAEDTRGGTWKVTCSFMKFRAGDSW